MKSAKPHLRSSIVKKLVNGATGLALVLFVVGHLGGNLTLLAGADWFNAYAHHLEGLGPLLLVVEFGLLAVGLAHVVTAIQVRTVDQSRARPVANQLQASKGAPSRQGISSRSMLFTGVVLLAFVIGHVWQFKFGPGVAQGYVTTVDGHAARDLYRLVAETFQQPVFVGLYVAVMGLLGVHLRHGFWSAFQSLGAINPRLRPVLQSAGLAFAVVMAFGFLMLPIFLYFATGGASVGSVAQAVVR